MIISTGVGSTGWLKSLLAGAAGVVQGATTRQVQPELLTKVKNVPPRAALLLRSEFPWDSNYLCFTVREPFPSKTTSAAIIFGRVTARDPLVLVSQMPEQGVIFSDGIEQDFLEFRSGIRATVTVAEKHGCLVV